MNRELRNVDYLDHIEQAIAKILRYTRDRDKTRFLDDELVQDAVIRNLEIVGEAVTKLSPELKAEHDDIPWGEISGMRNRLIHGYVSVDLDIVWITAHDVVPRFLARIVEIRRGLERSIGGGSEDPAEP